MKTNRIVLVLAGFAIVGVAAVAAVLLAPQWFKSPLDIYRLDADSAGYLEKVNLVPQTNPAVGGRTAPGPANTTIQLGVHA